MIASNRSGRVMVVILVKCMCLKQVAMCTSYILNKHSIDNRAVQLSVYGFH